MIDTGSLRNEMIATLLSDQPLTDEQKVAIAEELEKDPTGRGYASAGTPIERWKLFVEPYGYANPEPQGRVPITEWAPDELKNVLLQATVGGVPVWLAIKSLETHENPQLAGLAKLMPEVFTLKAISLENPLVVSALQTLKSIGILSDELYEGITTKPDPNYVDVLVGCRSDVVLGAGWVPLPSEIE